MKKVGLLVAAMGLAAYAVAGSVNPTSNVLADTAATANNLVLRDGNGAIDGTQLTNLSISAARLASSAVSVTRLFIDLPQNRVLCVTSARLMGYCQGGIGITGTDGQCNCSVVAP